MSIIVLWRTGVIGWLLASGAASIMYPAAPQMPAIAPDSIDSLLDQYQKLLAANASPVLAALQPGLSVAEIYALEGKHQFKLPPALRALYRWRNGTASGSTLNAFPDHRFVPLDEALAERDAIRKQVQTAPAAQRAAYAAVAAYRDAWLGLITDGAGDGFFFDPTRTEPQGSFFFSFAEDGSYIFFPSFGNYLKATVEGCDKGVFTFGASGSQTADFAAAQRLHLKYGAANGQ